MPYLTVKEGSLGTMDSLAVRFLGTLVSSDVSPTRRARRFSLPHAHDSDRAPMPLDPSKQPITSFSRWQGSQIIITNPIRITLNAFLHIIIIWLPTMSFIMTTADMYTSDESRDAVESPHVRPVTPDDHGSSFRSESFGDVRIKRSPSIPIAPGQPSRTLSEIRQDEEEAMADFRDYAMFARIVDGITKAQQKTRDCRWRHENDLSLQHVYRARQEGANHPQDSLTRFKLPEKLQLNLPSPQQSLVGLMSTIAPSLQPAEEDEDDALFVLEL